MSRIVIVGPAYPYRGGQALVEAHLYHQLSTLGHDVHTISFTLLYPSVFFPGTTQFDQSKKVYYSHPEKIHRIINSINPITWFKAFHRIKALNPDVVLFVWWMPFFGPAYTTIARLIKWFTKSKIAFLVENYISHENRWFDKLSSKITLNHADAFVCQSNYVKTRLLENHQRPIFKTTLSVYDCYDNESFSREDAKKQLGITHKHVVLFFGLIRKYKGLDKLILAFKDILKIQPDTCLLIAGECYDDEKYYTDIIEHEGIASNTLFVNKFIDNESIEPYFKAADMVCLPYNSATQSGILMMAYGFKRPAIVNDVGGLAELVIPGKTGLVTENNEPATIVRAVEEMFHIIENEDTELHISNLNKELGYKNLNEIVDDLTGVK